MQPSKQKSKMRGLVVSCYLASLITFCMSIYLIFLSKDKDLQLQAIYWFYLAVFCFIMPCIGPLIDRINHLRFGDFEVNLIHVKKTIQKVEVIFKLEEYLASDNSSYDENELENDIFNASTGTLTLINAAAVDLREKTVYSILRANNEDERNIYRRKLLRLIPVFKSLIKAKNTDLDKKHNYYAQLAYVYKDLPKPKWNLALENIDKAIEFRDQLVLGDLKYGIYEFNRLICRLNFNENNPNNPFTKEQLEEDFITVYQDGGCRYMLFGTSDSIAPGLSKWVLENKVIELNTWRVEHKK